MNQQTNASALVSSENRASSFIKTMPKHWKPDDFELSEAILNEPVLHIAKTVCLLESRCNDYADYLRAVFCEREEKWNHAIDQWNSDECQHGELLCKLAQAVDADFKFESLMARYKSLVSYHLPTGQSVRGSVGAELVCRCVVEALASTLYRVLADAVDDPKCRQVFSAIAQDEARHFAMFLKMLNAEAASTGRLGLIARCVYAFRRMIHLEDNQIMTASCVIALRSDAPIHLRRETNWYLARLYGLYRWKHLRYAARMLLQTINVNRSRPMTILATLALWTGIRIRWTWALVFSK